MIFAFFMALLRPPGGARATDDAWVLAFHAGERRALEEAYVGHVRAVVDEARKLLRTADAETVAHEPLHPRLPGGARPRALDHVLDRDKPQGWIMIPCIEKALVDAHFEGRISAKDETRLRAHLPTCAFCTEYYERRALFASLDPEALPLEERLGRPLGISSEHAVTTPSASTRPRLVVVALGLVAAAAIV